MTPPPADEELAAEPVLGAGEHKCYTSDTGEQWVPCGCDIGDSHTVADLEQAVADEVDPEQRIRETAESNAAWVEAVFRERRPDLLTFLRWRPHRELVDVLDAARRLGLRSAEEVLDGAKRLAANHTGSPSPCPKDGGYAAIVYPADEADVRKALDGLADYLRRAALPGDSAFLGWKVDSDVMVDYARTSVVATFSVVLPS